MNEYSEWCQAQFALLAEGGIWMVPRSGLTFQRQGDKLVLVSQMPFMEDLAASDPEFPQTAEALAKYQEEDFNAIQEQFRIAGITIESKVTS